MQRIAIALALSIAFVRLAAAQDSPKKTPNIVFIVSDDHGSADYGFLGHSQVKTPNLDKLAKQSLVFPNGYVSSSLCCPSLASILTGTYPHQNKITSNDPPPIKKNAPPGKGGRPWYAEQMKTLPSLARLLQQLQYLSFQTGKWWHGHFETGGFTHGMTKTGRHGEEGLVIGRKTMEPLYAFMKDAKAQGRPFFVWYAPMLPHTPHDPPERWLSVYRDKAPTLAVAKYWANIAWFDETCGQLLDHLDKTGMAENTIVVYVADNGWIQDEKKVGGFVRSKRTQYEAGHRTPIMIRWPGHVTPATVATRVSSIDLAPTTLKAVGLPVPAEMTGINLLDANAVSERKAVFGECFTHDAVDLENPVSSLCWRWVIEGPWRLVVPNPVNEPKAAVELYNLETDPQELNNLAAQDPDRVRRLRAALDLWWPAEKTETK